MPPLSNVDSARAPDDAEEDFDVSQVAAGQGGNIEILKYLKDNGCPWTEETFSSAAWKGPLHILNYLRENGSP
jgi:hypothetical protein